jgi:hypothetical protein
MRRYKFGNIVAVYSKIATRVARGAAFFSRIDEDVSSADDS